MTKISYSLFLLLLTLCGCQKSEQPKSQNHLFASQLAADNLGLDIVGYFNQASRKIAGEVIKYIYDRPSMIQNAGLDFHPDQFIPTDDNISLQISYYLPQDYAKQEKFPAVIFINPWGSSSNANQLSRLPQRLTKRGYIVLLLTARGFGKSGGEAVFTAKRDQEDVSLAIDWLLANTKADIDNIGITGISYGGGVGLMSLLHDKRIKTVVGMNTWVDLIDGGFFANHGINERAGRFLVEFGLLMQCRIAEAIKVRSDMLDPAKKDDVKAWGESRSASYFMDDFNERGAPIFFIHTYNDSFFKGSANLAFYNEYEGPKKVSFYLGVHGTNMMFEGFAGQGASQEAAEWFDYWLKGRRDKDININSVRFAIRNVRPTGRSAPAARAAAIYPQWQDENFEHITYYLSHQDKRGLLTTSPLMTDDRTALKTRLASGMFGGDQDGSLILEGLLGRPVQQDLSSLDRTHTAVYFTEPLAATKIRSISRLNVMIHSLSQNPQMIAYLFDQPPRGAAQLITQGSVEVAGFEQHQATANIEFTAIAYDLLPQHRIALVIDTKDWDFYAPAGQNNDFTILDGNGAAARLSLGIER